MRQALESRGITSMLSDMWSQDPSPRARNAIRHKKGETSLGNLSRIGESSFSGHSPKNLEHNGSKGRAEGQSGGPKMAPRSQKATRKRRRIDPTSAPHIGRDPEVTRHRPDTGTPTRHPPRSPKAIKGMRISSGTAK